MERRSTRRAAGHAFHRATQVAGADRPGHERLLIAERPVHRTGLVVFSAVFWFLAIASFTFDLRAGVVGGAIASFAVGFAARSTAPAG